MNTTQFNNYLAHSQKLSAEELLPLIDQYCAQFREDPLYCNFFKGEQAFYRKHYELALKHYVQGREIPLFPYFCFRASAWISEARGRHDKARSFAEKALAIYPEDKTIKRLLEQLKNDEDHDEPIRSIPLGTEEIDALSHLFKEEKIPTPPIQTIHPSEPMAASLNISKIHEHGEGFFFQIHDIGIALNPETPFVENFQSRFKIQDLDIVIVTQPHLANTQELLALYELNYQFNQSQSPLHVIHYYLHPEIYPQLAPVLKPRFKQERLMVHPLNFYENSSDQEKIELPSGMVLHYFAAENNLGICLECPSNGSSSIRIGYAAGSPQLMKQMDACDLIIPGKIKAKTQNSG